MFFCKYKKGLSPTVGQNFDQDQRGASLCFSLLSGYLEWNFLLEIWALFPAGLFLQNIPEQLFILHSDGIRLQYPNTAAETEHPG